MKIKFDPKPDHPKNKPVGCTIFGLGSFEPGDTIELAEPLNGKQQEAVDGLRHDERFSFTDDKKKAPKVGGGE
jgi:hypothetical protein